MNLWNRWSGYLKARWLMSRNKPGAQEAKPDERFVPEQIHQTPKIHACAATSRESRATGYLLNGLEVHGFLVADCPGGIRNGVDPSREVGRAFRETLQDAWNGTDWVWPAYWPLQEDDRRFEVPGRVLCHGLRSANRRLLDMLAHVPLFGSMGTRAVAAIISDGLLHLGHIGDSRAYLLRKNLEQLTTDHSWVHQALVQGDLNEREAKLHSNQSQVIRMLGIEREIRIDYKVIPLKNGDRILLSGRALGRLLGLREIEEVLKAYCSPEQALNRLMAATGERGEVKGILIDVIHTGTSVHGDIAGILF